jgi:uncharacterized protein YjbI with pentapeptide repeats
MKAEILQILQMQKDGKLTQDQAAELLAMLADPAREKDRSTERQGAQGPQAAAREAGGGMSSAAAATLHSLVDTAVSVGATVGRAATVWGGELVGMVHREESGNTLTLSKVEPPAGDGYTFKSNAFNVSKVSRLTLNGSEFANNTVNASDLSHVTLTRGRLSQCNFASSSVSRVTVEGPPAPGGGDLVAAGSVLLGGIRGSTFNATKFVRVRLAEGSQLEACTFQAAVVKELDLTGGAVVRDGRVNGSTLTASRFEGGTAAGLTVERSTVQGLAVKGAALDGVTLQCTRVAETTVTGGTWTNVKFRRDALGLGSGGRDSSLQEATFEDCTLTDCDFVGCTFRRTTLRGVRLTGVTVRNVDFTGLTLESEAAFRAAAGVG